MYVPEAQNWINVRDPFILFGVWESLHLCKKDPCFFLSTVGQEKYAELPFGLFVTVWGYYVTCCQGLARLESMVIAQASMTIRLMDTSCINSFRAYRA